MLDNIKSNKTVWITIGFVMISIIVIFTFISIQEQAEQDLAETEQTPFSSPPTKPNSEAPLQVKSRQNPPVADDVFANLVDDSLTQQPIPKDSSLVKDELSQLQDIQTQLKEQKDILIQQHQDADHLLKLKEEQLAALEQQLNNSAP